MIDDRKLLRLGLVGTILAALCCFTPVLVIWLGAIGASALVGELDKVLLPALFIFIGLSVFALLRQSIRNRMGVKK